MNPLLNNGNRVSQKTSQETPDFGKAYTKMMQNPAAFLSQIGVPRNITTAQGAVQFLLQSGRITQQQVEQAQKMAEQIQNKQPT